jgi:hypothetical protein
MTKVNVEPCKLPNDFNITTYLAAFKKLAPIPGVDAETDDQTATYVTNCYFVEYCENLESFELSVKHKGKVWLILTKEKEHLVHLGILPVVIHSGAHIYFMDTFHTWEGIIL